MIRWVDPRDGTRWLVDRRHFGHDAFGYRPESVVHLASGAESWFISEHDGGHRSLDDAYLMALLDRARGRGRDAAEDAG